MKEVKGTQIQAVHPYYEHIWISTEPGKGFFISSEDLVTILSEFDFLVEKKRTRSWGHVNIDDWTVEKKDEPRS